MPYEVLARKWRPKNFSELLGQKSVRQTLTNAVKQNRLYPVLLFTGPRGTGKTSTARIVSKNLRCQNQKNWIPCDECEDCRLIQTSRHLDVIEIDGASNNGVDAVRELRDTVHYMPSTGSWKIYIIDEAHMLSNSAFNALLKTFEEPPAHVLFIMATTEVRKIPQTVLSRVQRLDFHLLSVSMIKKQIESICKKEKISISEEVLWIIAKQARGSLRDGQSLLDQVITFCGKNSGSDEVAELLGLSDPYILFQCLQALIQGQEGRMIELIEILRTKGIEPRIFLQNLLESLSHLLFLKKNPKNDPELVQASEQEIEQMKKEIENISYEDLHLLFDMLLKGEREMTFCHDSHLVLEVLLLRLCLAPRLENLVPLKPWDQKKTPQPEVTLIKKTNVQNKGSSKSSLKTNNNSSLSGIKASEISQFIPKANSSDFERRFDFLDFLRKEDSPLAALVENLCLKQKSSKLFHFIVPEKFSYLKNKITSPSCHKILEEKLAEFLESKEKVKIEFLENEATQLNLRQEKQTIEHGQLLSNVQQNPFVNEVKELFGGKIKNVIPDHK